MNLAPRRYFEHPHAADVKMFDAAAELCGRIGALSVDLLVRVVADHHRGIPLAAAAGVSGATFADNEDLAVIWDALVVARSLGRDRTGAALLCRDDLRRAGWWNPDGPIGFGCFWSNESLNYLFSRWPLGQTALLGVPDVARQLVNTIARYRAAERIVAARRRLDTALWRVLTSDDLHLRVAELGERAA